jgi:protein-tyrosine phosphatase
MESVSVLFVCMGNICRSPTGEGVFAHYVDRLGHGDSIRIDSAGMIGYHAGEPADGRMRVASQTRGYRLDSIARQVRRDDVDSFDLIVPMDHENLRDLERLAGGRREHIRLLGTFLGGDTGSDGNGSAPAVPDPYYGGDAGFEAVLDMIEKACPAMLAHCLGLHDARR